MKVLLSIKPEFAEKIFNGTKKYEFRKSIFKNKDVDKVIELVKNAGGKIIKEPQNVFWGGYHAYFSDLDNYFWEVVWGPDFQFDENGLLKF